MHIKKIIRVLLHRTTIKIVGVIGIVGFFFILPTYAANDTSQNLMLAGIQEAMKLFLSLCSRLWIVIAILAGKLMTNDFVYGSVINMDVYLRKIRNIIKNFANFALAGLILFSIVQGIIGKQALDIKKTITNTLVAGILIQASWFLMGALVDISTITTAAISSFPMSFIQNDIGLQGTITNGIDGLNGFAQKRIIINLNASGFSSAVTTKDTETPLDITREKILPNENSASGPFVYLGMSVFQFQNYMLPGAMTNAINLSLDFILKFFFIFFFTAGLFLLLLANIMRIGLLWIFIIGAPFLILMQVFNKKIGSGSGGLSKIFSVSSLISTVFKPVIFVAGISLMLIVIVTVKKSIGSTITWENNLNGVSLSVESGTISTLSIPGITNIKVDQKDMLGYGLVKDGQNIFSTIIMLLLTLFIMRQFVKYSLIIGGGPIGETMEKLVKQAEDLAKALPIIPYKGGSVSFNGVGNIYDAQKKNMLDQFGVNDKGQFTAAESEFNKTVSKWMGIPTSRSQQDYDNLAYLADRGDTNFMNESKKLGKANIGGLQLSNDNRKPSLEKWLSTEVGKKALKEKGDELKKSVSRNGTFENTFKEGGPNIEDNRKALHMLMGGDAGLEGSNGHKTGGPNGDISYDQLMSNTYREHTENPNQ